MYKKKGDKNSMKMKIFKNKIVCSILLFGFGFLGCNTLVCQKNNSFCGVVSAVRDVPNVDAVDINGKKLADPRDLEEQYQTTLTNAEQLYMLSEQVRVVLEDLNSNKYVGKGIAPSSPFFKTPVTYLGYGLKNDFYKNNVEPVAKAFNTLAGFLCNFSKSTGGKWADKVGNPLNFAAAAENSNEKKESFKYISDELFNEKSILQKSILLNDNNDLAKVVEDNSPINYLADKNNFDFLKPLKDLLTEQGRKDATGKGSDIEIGADKVLQLATLGNVASCMEDLITGLDIAKTPKGVCDVLKTAGGTLDYYGAVKRWIDWTTYETELNTAANNVADPNVNTKLKPENFARSYGKQFFENSFTADLKALRAPFEKVYKGYIKEYLKATTAADENNLVYKIAYNPDTGVLTIPGAYNHLAPNSRFYKTVFKHNAEDFHTKSLVYAYFETEQKVWDYVGTLKKAMSKFMVDKIKAAASVDLAGADFKADAMGKDLQATLAAGQPFFARLVQISKNLEDARSCISTATNISKLQLNNNMGNLNILDNKTIVPCACDLPVNKFKIAFTGGIYDALEVLLNKTNRGQLKLRALGEKYKENIGDIDKEITEKDLAKVSPVLVSYYDEYTGFGAVVPETKLTEFHDGFRFLYRLTDKFSLDRNDVIMDNYADMLKKVDDVVKSYVTDGIMNANDQNDAEVMVDAFSAVFYALEGVRMSLNALGSCVDDAVKKAILDSALPKAFSVTNVNGIYTVAMEYLDAFAAEFGYAVDPNTGKYALDAQGVPNGVNPNDLINFSGNRS